MVKLPNKSNVGAEKKQFKRAELIAGNTGASLLFGTLCGVGLLGVLEPAQNSLRLWIGGAVFALSLIATFECLLKSSAIHSYRAASVQFADRRKHRGTTISARDELLRASAYPQDGRDNLLRPACAEVAGGPRELLRAMVIDAGHLHIPQD